MVCIQTWLLSKNSGDGLYSQSGLHVIEKKRWRGIAEEALWTHASPDKGTGMSNLSFTKGQWPLSTTGVDLALAWPGNQSISERPCGQDEPVSQMFPGMNGTEKLLTGTWRPKSMMKTLSKMVSVSISWNWSKKLGSGSDFLTEGRNERKHTGFWA